jgi:hypothetical protein
MNKNIYHIHVFDKFEKKTKEYYYEYMKEEIDEKYVLIMILNVIIKNNYRYINEKNDFQIHHRTNFMRD